MLRGTRTAVLQKIQPVSIHGQVSYDVHYVFVENDEERKEVARVGREDVAHGLEPGDRITLEILLNQVIRVSPAGAPEPDPGT
jgi:hypothetical protein